MSCCFKSPSISTKTPLLNPQVRDTSPTPPTLGEMFNSQETKGDQSLVGVPADIAQKMSIYIKRKPDISFFHTLTGASCNDEKTSNPANLAIRDNRGSPWLIAVNEKWDTELDSVIAKKKVDGSNEQLIPSGKWRFSVPKDDRNSINKIWFTIKNEIKNGKLLQAKCSLVNGAKQYKDEHTILVYVPDYTDKTKVEETYNYLVELGLVQKGDDIAFLSDQLTFEGKENTLFTLSNIDGFYTK